MVRLFLVFLMLLAGRAKGHAETASVGEVEALSQAMVHMTHANPVIRRQGVKVVEDAWVSAGLSAALASSLMVSHLMKGESDTELREKIWTILIQTDDVESWMRLIGHPGLGEETATRLQGTGVLAWRVSKQALKDPRTRVRQAAARALRGAEGAEMVFVLINTARDPEPWVRQEAVKALATFSTPEAVRAIERALRDAHPAVVTAAQRALTSRKEELK